MSGVEIAVDVARGVELAVAAGVFDDDENPAVVLYDLDALGAKLDALAAAFPGALHALAVKACPLPALLRMGLERGFGLEVASQGEVALAERIEAKADRVVFDSPAKTKKEIAAAMAAGHRLNVDNFEELARVAAVAERTPPRAPIGLRVNPGLSGSTIAQTFTAAPGAKFGVPMHARAAIVDAYRRHAWLDAIHVHVGSQGVPLALLVEAVGQVADLGREIVDAGGKLRVFDVGGGLPVRYGEGDAPPDFAAYRAALAARAPDLVSGRFELVTEFGRAIFANAGFAVSRVEYLRPGNVAVVHVGADMFIRAVYRPSEWSHAITVLDPRGRAKDGPRAPATVAGPLCFSGDFLAKDRPLPPIVAGDLVVVHDAGAYTLSMWSRYNSRPAPAVYGFDRDGIRLLKARESVDDVLRFWGA